MGLESDTNHQREVFHIEGMKETTASKDCDGAIEIFEGDDNFHYTSEEELRVRWKLDLILLPLMFFTYVFAAIDKIALSEASIFGIKKSDNLAGQDYSWASSMFYFGYLAFQYPSSRLMQKLPLGRYFGAMVILWGLVTTSTAATTSFSTLAVNRFFLGFFESCQNPILTILVSQYWTRKEQPLRACIWWAGGAVGFFLGDSITYGVSGATFAGSSYAAWQVSDYQHSN
jgi:MFS family permease